MSGYYGLGTLGTTICQGKGVWNLYYRLPKKTVTPKQICVTYPNSVEVCFVGDSYQLDTNQPPFQGGQCSDKTYFIKFTITFYSPQFGGYPDQRIVPGAVGWEGRLDASRGTFSQLSHEIIPDIWNPQNADNAVIIFRTTGNNNNNPITASWTGDVGTGVGSGKPFPYRRMTISNMRLERTDGTSLANDIAQCGTLPTTYRLRIFNNSGGTVFDNTTNNQPTIREIPASEKCEYNKWVLFSQIINPDPNGSLYYINYSKNGKRCVKVFWRSRVLKTTGFGVIDKLALDLCDDQDCDMFPQVKVPECEPNFPPPPEAKRCPPNTAFQCEGDGVICCYDENCKLIGTIKKY